MIVAGLKKELQGNRVIHVQCAAGWCGKFDAVHEV